ncbi:MAG: VTT domain-containing protein [Bacteroidetes bacterium]|nr:VTT domain-containing protein [Bacteroidota bacterium]MCL5737416.1 VTT domain-containing protein [Bacteroidota bacterium]
MENFIHQNGYVTVFLTVAFSGEFGLFAGIALARAGSVTLPGVIAVGTIASFVGNMFYFYAGKLLWTKWHFLKNKFEKKVEKTSSVVRRFGSPLMLIARFFYGVRDVVPIALGVYDVGVGIFAIYNFVGAVLWAWFFTEAGNMFSGYLIKSFTGFRESLLWGLLTSAIVAGLYFLVRKAVSRFQG